MLDICNPLKKKSFIEQLKTRTKKIYTYTCMYQINTED